MLILKHSYIKKHPGETGCLNQDQLKKLIQVQHFIFRVLNTVTDPELFTSPGASFSLQVNMPVSSLFAAALLSSKSTSTSLSCEMGYWTFTKISINVGGNFVKKIKP